MIYADNLDAPPNSLLDSTPKPARPIPFCAGDPHIVIALVGVFLAAFVPSSCHRNYIEFCERSLINELIRSKGEKETEREGARGRPSAKRPHMPKTASHLLINMRPRQVFDIFIMSRMICASR